jgi:glucose/arabinose dehydrogenase
MPLRSHSAPNDLVFYTGSMFPSKYRNGAFIAFHGGWGRAPFELAGFSIGFVPFSAMNRPSGQLESFADGFAGTLEPLTRFREAKFRPVGLAAAPDGALYVADSKKGRIWRVSYPSATRLSDREDQQHGAHSLRERHN